jgi:hypothetical protein
MDCHAALRAARNDGLMQVFAGMTIGLADAGYREFTMLYGKLRITT